MKTINRDQLETVLHQAFKDAHQSNLSGWRIPIYVNGDGEVHAGSWLSDSSWQPDLIELIAVRTWDVNDVYPDCISLDSDVYFAITEHMMPWIMERIEERLKEANRDDEYIEYSWLKGYELS